MDPSQNISLTPRADLPEKLIAFDEEPLVVYYVNAVGRKQLTAFLAKAHEFRAFVIERTGAHIADLAPFSVLFQIALQHSQDLGISSTLGPTALLAILKDHLDSPTLKAIGGFELVEDLLLQLALPENKFYLNKFQEYLLFFARGWKRVTA